MKKFVLIACLSAVVALSSCTGTKKAEDEGAALKTKIENCTDPDSLKIYVQQANAYAAKLISEGRDTDAQAYLDQVVPVVTAKDPTLVEQLTKDVTEAKDAACDKACEVKDSAAAKVDDVKEAAGKAAENVKDAASKAASDAADKVKDGASEAVNSAKDAASKAAGDAADKVKKAFK